MNGELTGGLIQMTAHMEVTAGARAMMAAGAVLAVLFALLTLAAAASREKEHKWRYVLIFAAFMAMGFGLIIAGGNAPREKIIQCCASGPVSLEQVAVRYDIREIDGKLLVLAER